jgi:hypothetical protein
MLHLKLYIFQERLYMKQPQFALTLLLSLCIGLFSLGIVSAQNQVILSENYTSAPDRIIFLYPTGWTVNKQDLFVSVSDTQTTIEFYTLNVSQNAITQAGNDLGKSITDFFNILGVETVPDQPIQITLNEEAFIGTSVIDKGQIQYLFLVKGSLMPDDTLVFVRVQGNALALTNSPDEFLAIIKTFGTILTPAILGEYMNVYTFALYPELHSPTGNTNVNAPNSAAPGRPATNTTTQTTADVPAVPCMVQAISADTATLRVGPGTNRSILLYLSSDDTFEVIGTANDSDGLRWWRLDKTKAAPKKAAQVNETWVSDAHMTESGDCDAVGTVAAPRIIRAKPVPVAQPVTDNSSDGDTSAPRPQPVEGSTEPFIDFFANPSSVDEGDCTTLFWDVRNVREIYFIDDNGHEKGVTGPTGSETVCPSLGLGFNFVTYTLRIVPLTGESIFTEVQVTINPTQHCLIAFPYVYETNTLAWGDTKTHSVFVDPTCGGTITKGATVFITVMKQSGSADQRMDPYIDVYKDDQYIGTDDNGGGNLDSFMQLDLFEPATIKVYVLNNIDPTGTGVYAIEIFIAEKIG